MAETTVYKTIAQYLVQDFASNPAKKIAMSFDLAAKAAGGLTKKIKGLATSQISQVAAGIGLGLGFHAIAKGALEANKEIDSVKDTLSGAIFAFKPWEQGLSNVERMKKSVSEADDVFKKLEETEMRLAVPIETLTLSYKTLAGPLFSQYQKSQKDVLKLNEQVVASAIAMGEEPRQALEVVAQALVTKTIPTTGALGKALKASAGDLKKLSDEQVYRKITTELGKIAPAAEPLQQSFGAQMFRLTKGFSNLLRDVTRPTFLKLTELAAKWSKKLQEVVKDGKTLQEVYGQKLLSFLTKAADLTKTFLSHWKEIAAVMVANFTAAKLAALSTAAANLAAAAGGGRLGAVATNLGKFTGKLAGAVPALGAFTAAAIMFADWLEKRAGKNVERERLGAGFGGVSVRLAEANRLLRVHGAGRDTERLHQIGNLIKDALEGTEVLKKGRLNVGELRETFRQMPEEMAKQVGVAMGIGKGASPGALTDRFVQIFKQLSPETKKAEPEKEKEGKPKTTRPPVVNNTFTGPITLHQKFEEGESDRVFVRFKQDLEAQAEKRTMSSVSPLFAE